MLFLFPKPIIFKRITSEGQLHVTILGLGTGLKAQD